MTDFSSCNVMSELKSSTTSGNDGKRIDGISARLLQGTVSSSAKSGFTPTLPRKFGSATKNSRQTPGNSTRIGTFGSGRKVANDSAIKSGKAFVASSAKKLVLNSTSEEENVHPADWDASAINPPTEDHAKSNKT